ncbi:MAG: hypothetical protein NE328_09520 [Lentisphaeraceae bacterium]|nr:hypothetical protein [Lentisphaeraceae bacterium]
MIRIKPILTAILLVVFVSSLSAQTRKDYVVTVTDVEVRNNVRSPDSPSPIDNKRSGNPKKWAVIFVDYTVEFPNKKAVKVGLDDGLWLNNVSVTWDFLYKPAKMDNKIQNYIRFNKTVEYIDIKQGKHTALMFINPVILERYFNEGKSIKKDLILKFSLKANGFTEPKGTVYYAEGKVVKAKDTATYVKSFAYEGFKTMPGVLMSRDESPFKNIQYDIFDQIKAEK